MINRLKFTVTFPSTNKTFTDEHHFQSGMTTITGPNEAGKSLRLEMSRYAFWGSKALRASPTKYKDLRVEQDFTVRGVAWSVSRTPSKILLSKAGVIVATGTTAVNLKMATDVFGYGMDVFDTSHSIGQGQIEALGAMQPADRKRMVDSVIGLNVLDSLIEFASKTATGFNREVEGLEQGLVPPVVPVKPDDYFDSGELKTELVRLEGLKTEKDQITGQLSVTMAKPGAPTECEVTATVVELEAAQELHISSAMALERLSLEHDGIPDPIWTAEELDKVEAHHEKWKLYETYRKKIEQFPPKPKPTMTADEIAVIETQWLALAAWEAATARYEQHKAVCPNCDYEWAHGQAYPGARPMTPAIASVELVRQKLCLTKWASAPDEVAPVASPPFGVTELGWQRDALAKVQRKLDLVPLIDAALAQVKLYPNVNGMLQVRRTYEAAIDRWVSAQTAWEAEQARRACLQTRLATMFNVENALEQVRTRYMACHFYEMQVTQHSVAAAKYAQGLALVATAKAGAAEYRKAREALVGLKATVKSHLVPSLNKVASVLLSQMTGGVRNVIAVDEDFNIKVDGQALDELSGSAKAVANLAIRIGLGQVLTNRVFGVLLGDELDAAMDEERGGFTADCLRGLTGRIPQVILVTHKRPEADAYIELEQAA